MPTVLGSTLGTLMFVNSQISEKLFRMEAQLAALWLSSKGVASVLTAILSPSLNPIYKDLPLKGREMSRHLAA